MEINYLDAIYSVVGFGGEIGDAMSTVVDEVCCGVSKLGAAKRCEPCYIAYGNTNPIDSRVQEGTYHDPKPTQ
jgi:hypothetical protein